MVLVPRQGDRALDAVLELAHVPRPAVGEQTLRRRRRDAGHVLAGLARVAREEVLGEQQDVAAARAERRQRQVHDVDAVEEILAEASASTADSRSRLVAVTSRTSNGTSMSLPTGRTLRSCSARSSFGCSPSGISADLVEEERPAVRLHEEAGARAAASVNAPRAWPKSSLSSRGSGIAAQLTATNGPWLRRPRAWSARATTSLPVPLSPVTRTVASDAATRARRSSTSCIAGLLPMSSPQGAAASTACRSRATSSRSTRCRIARVERVHQELDARRAW